MNFQEVVEWNKNIQRRSCELNQRADENIFPVMTKERFCSWLQIKTNEAKRIKDIQNLNDLMLPDLDSKKVEKILSDNPDKVNLYGKKFKINYYDFCMPIVLISFEYLQACSLETQLPLWQNNNQEEFLLPRGKRFKLRLQRRGVYTNIEVDNRADLKDEIQNKLNLDAAKEAFKNAKEAYERFRISDLDEVFRFLPRLLEPPIKISNEVNAYLALAVYGNLFDVCLVEKSKQASQLNYESINRLFLLATAEDLIIPDTKSFYHKGYYSDRCLNDLGKTLENRFAILIKKYSRYLTIHNVRARVEKVKKEVQEIIVEMEENVGLYSVGFSELTFDFLMNNKRVKELTYILKTVQDTLNYSEEVVIKAIYSLTKNENGLPRRGNKLWMELRKKFKGEKREFEVNTESLAFKIMELVED